MVRKDDVFPLPADTCAREPIHLIGSIQPHGMLPVIEASAPWRIPQREHDPAVHGQREEHSAARSDERNAGHDVEYRHIHLREQWPFHCHDWR